MKKLTIKQDKFVLKYFDCGNATEAYRHAYNAEAMKDETVSNNAHKLLNNNEITTRLSELQIRATTTTILTVTQRKERLSSIILSGEDKDAIRAIDVLNKMEDSYTQKIEHYGNIGNIIVEYVD